MIHLNERWITYTNRDKEVIFCYKVKVNENANDRNPIATIT